MAHENEDPKNLLIIAIGVGSIITIAGTMYGLASYYDILRDQQQHSKVLGVTNPELTALRDREAHVLNGYAALDPDKKRIRIPIESAMKMLAQRGRDFFPAISTKPENLQIQPAGGPAPAASGSAAPAASGSAAPATSASAAPASSAGDKDKKKKPK